MPREPRLPIWAKGLRRLRAANLDPDLPVRQPVPGWEIDIETSQQLSDGSGSAGSRCLRARNSIWRETQADRFTGFDRRLLEAADSNRWVDDGVGASDAWAALTRGRLRRLEVLGLATREGRRYRLDAELEPRLRSCSCSCGRTSSALDLPAT